ncbi:D-alanine--D-alanine ligase family protein [Arthrobacter sp. MA-N2]|uniref:D-alanine--D-alanine ligase family protein n=1 Tax=Arthrobacter sp. MA-N2 TaxID=1101188 RepID=UPI0004B66B26|nr:ATP-grasp domain-containing protein [Arthrobacter sp. MA-N2]
MTTVFVLGGGTSPEHVVSLASAATISTTLKAAGHDVRHWTIQPDGEWTSHSPAKDPVLHPLQVPGAAAGAAAFLAEAASAPAPAVVYPTLHGAPGEDGAVAGLCALAGLRLAASPLAASAAAMDKWITKQLAATADVATVASVLLGPDHGPLAMVHPAVVKPVTAGSSHGVSLVRDEKEMSRALSEARALSSRVLVEPLVHGREIDVALFDDGTGRLVVLPPLEIHTEGLFDTSTKYDGTARFTVPAEIPTTISRELSGAAERMYRALGCWGIARMDFFVTDDGVILNEVNTAPGMSHHSQVPQMAAAGGWQLARLLNELVSAARIPA